MILKIIFTLMVLIHGLIHFLGFIKAFNIAEVPQLKQKISRITGLIWLISGLLFLITGVLIWIYPDKWWILGLAAIILSQVMIFTSWQDAKFGTIANILILLISFLSIASYSFEKGYKVDVQSQIEHSKNLLKI